MIDCGMIRSIDFPNGSNIKLQPNNNGIKFTLEIDDSIIYENEKWEYRDLEIIQNELLIKIPILFLTNRSSREAKGEIRAFKYGEIVHNEQKYNRLVLPLNKRLNFSFSIENVLIDYINKIRISTNEATEITINGVKFLLFIAKEEVAEKSKINYLVIESKTKLEYLDFSEYCFSILISFGFVSGDFINNDGYFFQYNSRNMTDVLGIEYRRMRGSIKCQYVPIYSNAYGYLHDREKAAQYNDKLRKLKIIEFSKLCQYCHSKDDIKTILLLIIEANNQSLVGAPGILSIALETLSNVIYDENETTLAPIKSKSTSKTIRKELIKIIDSFKNEIEFEGSEILKAKINQINQRTNRDKLLIPFKILKIPITTTDIEAIEQRNAFLHGRTPMVQEIEPRSINEVDKFRYYLYLKLYVLISSVIMKYVGFDNLVLNYPKIYEKSTEIELTEEYYKQI